MKKKKRKKKKIKKKEKAKLNKDYRLGKLNKIEYTDEELKTITIDDLSDAIDASLDKNNIKTKIGFSV